MSRKLIVALGALSTLVAGAALAQDGPPPGPRRMPSPEEFIKQIDKNADGAIDKAEWTGAGRPEERFAGVDADNDGKITAEELKVAFEKMRQRRMQQGGGEGPPPGPPPEGAPPQN